MGVVLLSSATVVGKLLKHVKAAALTTKKNDTRESLDGMDWKRVVVVVVMQQRMYGME